MRHQTEDVDEGATSIDSYPVADKCQLLMSLDIRASHFLTKFVHYMFQAGDDMGYKPLKLQSEALRVANSIASSSLNSITGVAIRRVSGQIVTVSSEKIELAASQSGGKSFKQVENSKTLRGK